MRLRITANLILAIWGIILILLFAYVLHEFDDAYTFIRAYTSEGSEIFVYSFFLDVILLDFYLISLLRLHILQKRVDRLEEYINNWND